MKAFVIGTVVLLALALTGTASDEQDKSEQLLRLYVELVDGSRVIGIHDIESVPLHTSYARMEIPLQHILAIKIAEHHEIASFDLRNGDHLKGAVHLELIELETIFGKVSVGIEHVREFRVVLAGETLPDALRIAAIFNKLRADGIAAYYPFSGNAFDASENGYNGTVYNATLSDDRFGSPQEAYTFNGTSSYIGFPPDPALAFSGDFTLAAWVRSTRGSGWQGIASYENAGKYGYGLCLRSDGIPGAWIGNGSSWEYAYGSTAIRGNGKWHHLAAVRRSGILRFYLDGVAQGVTTAHPVAYSCSYALIGKHVYQDQYFGGSIDDVRFYKRALSDAEVNKLVKANIPTPRPPKD